MSISYTIRKWAFAHPRFAQGLIVLATMLLFFIGHILGVLADKLGWDTYAMFLIGTGVAILAWTLAPRKGEDFPIRYTYARQKVAVVIMLTSMTIGVGGWAVCLEKMNFEPIPATQMQFSEAAIGPEFSKKPIVIRLDHTFSNWFYGGISKRLLKRTRHIVKKHFQGVSSKADNVIAGIVIYFIALLLALLVALLSCSLSCNGQVVLSVLVALGGLLLVLAFVDGNLRKIKSRSPKKTRRKAKQPSPDL